VVLLAVAIPFVTVEILVDNETVSIKTHHLRYRYYETFWKRHSLGLVVLTVLALLLALYNSSDPKSHAGSFFGNAIADWSGVLVTVLATKWFFEKGSAESRQPRPKHRNAILEKLHEHSLTIFLALTGLGWVLLFVRFDPDSKWGTVVSNLVSEWSQQAGLVILTKHLFEWRSKESDH
jgi:hypothetical protein